MTSSEIAPGWYKDPAEPATQRYWDGEGWIGDPLPADATPPDRPPAVAPAVAPLPAARPTPAPGPPPPTRLPPTTRPPAGGRATGAGRPAGAALPPGATLPPGVSLPPGATLPPPGTAWSPPPGWRPGQPLPPGAVLPPGYSARYPYVLVRPRPHGLPVAPLGLRLVARLIDIAVVLALNVAGNGWFMYLWIKDLSPYVAAVWRAASAGAAGTDLPSIPERANVLTYVIPLVAMALWFAYEVPNTASTGQTFGKRVVGIKVMALERTEPIGFRRAFRRWNPLGLPVLLWACGIGFILQLVDCISPALGGPLQLALHDRTAQTVVVHSGRRGHEQPPEKVSATTGEET